MDYSWKRLLVCSSDQILLFIDPWPFVVKRSIIAAVLSQVREVGCYKIEQPPF